tara:strand:- start:3 stop:188 length:186 start_codon:yes stop_codon:yes gene_type:complete
LVFSSLIESSDFLEVRVTLLLLLVSDLDDFLRTNLLGFFSISSSSTFFDLRWSGGGLGAIF